LRNKRYPTQLLDDLRETRTRLNLKQEALDRTPQRTRSGRKFGHVVRHHLNYLVYLEALMVFGFYVLSLPSFDMRYLSRHVIINTVISRATEDEACWAIWR
jgi:hypothetical protein